MPRYSPTTSTKRSSLTLERLRHSLAHVLAAAVQEISPGAKFGVGPTIEDGFYYDIEVSRPLTTQDLPRLERRMRAIIERGLTFQRSEKSFADALTLFTKRRQPYKIELINDLQTKGSTYLGEGVEQAGDAEMHRALQAGLVTLYTVGDFVDLCRGGHVQSTAQINPKAFRLTRLSGAYWRGDQKKPQLQRIYGVAFASEKELADHLDRLDRAAARDHRKLGKELDLFSFHEVAPGAVFWHPKGMVLWQELEKLLREYLIPAGYDELQTPLMVKPDLFIRSGHLKHYSDKMFRVLGNDEEFYLKPMNCPESAIVYATRNHSYRDLPLRFAEIGRIHRNELSGTLGGLFRVRQITQDDGHIYCRPDQLESEITNLLKLGKTIYGIFGLKPSFYLSTRPDNAMGDPKLWNQAERSLTGALKANKLAFEEKPKEGTFYAPKIDIDITDSLGRRWQLCTIQADLVMVPSLPGVEYVDRHGHTQKPVVIHRAIYGSFERFIGILVEHYAGAFPTWLAPVQIQLVPVGSRHTKPAQKLAKELASHSLRVNVDEANETVGYKIRKATKQHVPYLLVIGDKEAKGTKLAIRIRGSDRVRSMTKKSFLGRVTKKIAKRSPLP